MKRVREQLKVRILQRFVAQVDVTKNTLGVLVLLSWLTVFLLDLNKLFVSRARFPNHNLIITMSKK